jgi:hypothetical protein
MHKQRKYKSENRRMVHASTHRVHPKEQRMSVYITTMTDPIDER